MRGEDYDGGNNTWRPKSSTNQSLVLEERTGPCFSRFSFFGRRIPVVDHCDRMTHVGSRSDFVLDRRPGEGDGHSARLSRVFEPRSGKANQASLGNLSSGKGSIVAISIRCECGHVFETRDENAGRRGRCPACQRVLLVPKGGVTADEFYEPLEELGPQQTSGKAIASLILGLASPFLCFFTGLPAIILGSLGLSDINNPKKNVKGKGMAVTGMVLGGICTLGMVPAVLIALLLPAVQAAREAARRAQCVNNLKQIALAMHNYESTNGCFPPAATFDADGKPLLSWRVILLPFLEEQSLYNQFHLDEPWDSPHNLALAASMPHVFTCPSQPPVPNQTTYAVVVDPHSMFTGKAEGVRIASITDGTSNTLLVTESISPVPWTQPEGLTLESSSPLFDMGSKHPGGWNVVMADGSVRFFRSAQVNEQLLKALVTRDGNEVVSPP